MTTHLLVKPNVSPMSWKKFCNDSEKFSIALDGYVKEKPKFDPTGPRVNFNHHEDVSRLETRATCAQVLIAIRQGLFETFCDESGSKAYVYVNDCDEDVCTSWFLLNNAYMIHNTMNPLLNRLVGMEDMLDTTAGAYPFPKDLPALEELAWVFQPYRQFRLSGELDNKKPEAHRSIIEAVEDRIFQHISGKGKKIPIDLRYKKIDGGKNWTMIEETGAQGRTGAFADGIRAYVSVSKRPDGNWSYTVGRMSLFIPFDVKLILDELTKAETSPEKNWGGGNTIGGSPRVGGSFLPPNEVIKIINNIVK